MEEREKAKQIGVLSPQSGDEADEMDILNLFQTLALNHCFFYNVEKLTVITDILISHLHGPQIIYLKANQSDTGSFAQKSA